MISQWLFREQIGASLVGSLITLVIIAASMSIAARSIALIFQGSRQAVRQGEVFDVESYVLNSIDCASTANHNRLTCLSGWSDSELIAPDCSIIGGTESSELLGGQYRLRSKCSRHIGQFRYLFDIEVSRKEGAASFNPWQKLTSAPITCPMLGQPNITLNHGDEYVAANWAVAQGIIPQALTTNDNCNSSNPSPDSCAGVFRSNNATLKKLCEWEYARRGQACLGTVSAIFNASGPQYWNSAHNNFCAWWTGHTLTVRSGDSNCGAAPNWFGPASTLCKCNPPPPSCPP